MKFVVYSKDDCPWCTQAKQLLSRYGYVFDEYKLNVDYTREELSELLPEGTRLTVPQVFVDGHRIGGYEDLLEYFTMPFFTMKEVQHDS